MFSWFYFGNIQDDNINGYRTVGNLLKGVNLILGNLKDQRLNSFW